MANQYALTMEIAAPPDVVWAVIGDPTSVPRWFPKYVSCEIEGDVRTLTNAEGGVLVEKLLERDDSVRRYAYGVISGAPLKSHRASFQVIDSAAGSRVIWHTEAEFTDPAIDTETRLGPAQRDGLARLKALIEDGKSAK